MAKYIVIGGGLAGISSAVHLAKKNHKVVLLEASPKLGGRAYSFFDKSVNDVIDNGQHILMGAYKNTFELLKILKTEKDFFYQKTLNVAYMDRDGREYFLKASNGFYPFNLIQAILRFNKLNLKERFEVLQIFVKIFFLKEKKIQSKTVSEWLKENNQSGNTINNFWKLLVVSTLNTTLSEASAAMFVKVLKEIFFNGNKFSTIVLPSKGLSELFSVPAEKYLLKKGTEIYLSEKVISIESSEGKIKKVITDKKEITNFDFVIFAVPHYSLQKIFKELSFITKVNKELTFSSIITIHLWFNEIIFEKKFYGLLGSQIHWIYKNKNHYSVVISAADEMLDFSSEKIFQICISELKIYFPKIKKINILNYKVIKEKRATFKATPQSCAVRTQIKSSYKNFILAGDWTNTKLPATIEGAILSGKLAAWK